MPNLKKLFILSGNRTFLYFRKGIFRTLTYLEPEAYSEHCQRSMMECLTKNSYLAHFLAQIRKTKKKTPRKKFLIF